MIVQASSLPVQVVCVSTSRLSHSDFQIPILADDFLNELALVGKSPAWRCLDTEMQPFLPTSLCWEFRV